MINSVGHGVHIASRTRGIDGAVYQIDQQIDDDDGARDQQHAELEHGIVAPQRGTDQQVADAVPGEDRLDDDSARNQGRHLQADAR